ncbi:hypothetical protein [Pectobacterium parvum]|uniref:hypothetical protein n=1 Tax=Pectobacterium parvum TaxID=2778550 RepID=UPI0011BF08BF|nr:hypothetical protein [Pectobacterium parvum]
MVLPLPFLFAERERHRSEGNGTSAGKPGERHAYHALVGKVRLHVSDRLPYPWQPTPSSGFRGTLLAHRSSAHGIILIGFLLRLLRQGRPAPAKWDLTDFFQQIWMAIEEFKQSDQGRGGVAAAARLSFS